MHDLVANLIEETGERKAYEIARSIGYKIKEADTPRHVNGFITELLDCKFIVVNERLEDWQKRAIIAHELGHIVLHPDYHYLCFDDREWYRSARMEKEADEFATEMFRQLSAIDPAQIASFLQSGWE